MKFELLLFRCNYHADHDRFGCENQSYFVHIPRIIPQSTLFVHMPPAAGVVDVVGQLRRTFAEELSIRDPLLKLESPD